MSAATNRREFVTLLAAPPHMRRAALLFGSDSVAWGPYLNQFPAGATKVLGAIRGDRITPVKDGSQRGVSCTARSTANEARLS
jgi:hypothetical protein